jgi:signal transduction histidine kinase
MTLSAVPLSITPTAAPTDRAPPAAEATPRPHEILSILSVNCYGWLAFGSAYIALGRWINGSIDLVVCALCFALRAWMSRRYRGTAARPGDDRGLLRAVHAFMGVTYVGMIALCLDTGQSSAMALWYFVCFPLFAAYVGGVRMGVRWTVLATLGVSAVHASEYVAHIPREFVPLPGELLVDKCALIVIDMAFAGAYVRATEAHLAALRAREVVITAQARELVVARDAALDAARVKSDFLANMSHEIRTPMNAVLGYADLLLAADLSPQVRAEHARTIRANGEHLLALLNDILDLSKLEAGRMSVESIAFDPRELVAEVAAIIRPRAEQAGLTLEAHAASETPALIRSDPTRLRQIALNLASNAVKFTRAGGVRIELTCDPATSADRRLRVAVSDTGVGLTPTEQGRLFRPFSQADSSTTRRFGGTGLGLSISQRLATLLGGAITVQSSAGQGSTFTVSLRLETPPDVATVAAGPIHLTAPEPDVVAPPRGLGGRVLVVEDVAVNRRLMAILLEALGATVTAANDGADAVERALAGDAFDLILMDMQMPVLDGYDATAALRRAGYAGPIVALTAHAMADDRARCLRVGCDDYLTKPIDRGALAAVVHRYLRPA